MAVSKINFICSDFSYAPQVAIDWNTIPQPRNPSWFTLLKKVLVTGGEPLNIDSITVVDKVVRVVTTAKNFVSVPGAKLEIAGTGVAMIDQRQELSEVFTDGFSFTVDTPDAVYTNGVTYNYASLGWQLLDQDANRLLVRSGSGAMTPFNILFSRERSRDNSYNCICYYVNYGATSFKDLLLVSPERLQDQYYFPSRVEVANDNLKTMYWIYGDDAILYVCSGGDTTTLNNFHFTSLISVGESKSLNNSTSHLFMFGRHSSNISAHDFSANGYAYTSSPFAYTGDGTYSFGNPTNLSAHLGYYFNKTSKDSFLRSSGYYANSFTVKISGSVLTSASTFINSYSFLPTYLLNENFNKIGFIPGFYYIDFNVSLLNPSNKNFISYKTVLNSKPKKTVIVKYGSPQGTNLTTFSTTLGVSVLLDLTGPIR